MFNYQLNHRPSGRNQFFLRVSCLPNENFVADAPAGVLLGILGGGVQPGSSNNDPLRPLQTKKCNFPKPFSHQTSKNPYPFSDLTFRQKLFNHYLAGRKQKILQILFKFAYFFLLSLSLLIFHDKYVQILVVPSKTIPIPDQNGQNVGPFSVQIKTAQKDLPDGAAHTYIAYIREYPSPPLPRAEA